MRSERAIFASFLESMDEQIHASTMNGARNMWESLISNREGAVDDILDINVVTPVKKLADICETISSLREDAFRMKKFFDLLLTNNRFLESLDKAPISVYMVDPDEITAIRATYISQPINNMINQAQKIRSAGANGGSVARSFAKANRDPAYLKNLKNQAVVSKLPDYMKNGELYAFKNKKAIPISGSTISTLSLMIGEFVDVKTAGKLGNTLPIDKLEGASFFELALSIKKVVNSTTTDFKSVVKTLTRLCKEEGANMNQINSYLYMQQTIYMELVKYVTAMAMRYMNIWAYNMRALSDARRMIQNRFGDLLDPNETLFTESGDELGLPDDSEIRTKKRILLERASELQRDVQLTGDVDLANPEKEYDREAFDTPYPVFGKIDNALEIFMLLSSFEGDPNLPIEAIVDESELKLDVIKQQLDDIVDKLASVKWLDTVEWQAPFVYTDLLYCTRLIGDLDEMTLSTREDIDSALTAFSMNVNDLYPNSLRNKDAADILKDLDQALVSTLHKAYESIKCRMRDIVIGYKTSKPVFVPVMNADDPLEDVVSENSDLMESARDEELLVLNQIYEEKYRKSRLIFMEADENNGNNNNGQNPPQNGQNGGRQNQNNGNNQNGNKQSTKPVVNDNGNNGNTNQNNQNQNTNQNNGNNQNGDGNQAPLVDRVKNFIKGLIDKVKKFASSEEGGQKNLDFINKNREKLINRSYTNVSIQILPYIEIDYVETVKKVIGVIVSIDDKSLATLDEKRLENRVFASTALASVKGDNLGDRLTQALSVGNQPNELKTVQDGELKNMIPGMLDFCTNYYNNIANDLEEISNATDQLSAIANKRGSGDNDNTTANVAKLGTYLNAMIGAVVNVARKRSNDYMEILSKLAPKDTDNNNQNNNGNNNGAQQAENNTQGGNGNTNNGGQNNQ